MSRGCDLSGLVQRSPGVQGARSDLLRGGNWWRLFSANAPHWAFSQPNAFLWHSEKFSKLVSTAALISHLYWVAKVDSVFSC